MAGYEDMLRMARDPNNSSWIYKDGFAGICGDHVCFVGGFIEIWAGRASAWALIDGRVGKSVFLAIHRHVFKAIKAYQPSVFKRLEMSTLETFEKAGKWAESLGFVKECVMEHYDPWGRAHGLYSRVKV